MRCADGSALPCIWGPGNCVQDADTCEFSAYSATLSDGSTGLKLARTGTCSVSYGSNQLFLRGHGLKELDDNIFDGMSALTKIDISGNQITSLPSDICNGLHSVQTFNVGDNNLVTLPSDGTFSGCTSMTELVLTGNALRYLPVTAFGGLTTLQRVSMDDQTAKGGGLAIRCVSYVLGSEGVAACPTGTYEVTTQPECAHAVAELSAAQTRIPYNGNSLWCDTNVLKVANGYPCGFTPYGNPPICRAFRGGKVNLGADGATSYRICASSACPASAARRSSSSYQSYSLPATLLNGLSSLIYFSAHSSGLETLLAGFFSDQINLQELYLHDNAITCLPSDIFRPLTSLTRLDIQGNPDLECGGPIYSWGALASATTWDGGGCASNDRTWCRPQCSNKYDPGHADKIEGRNIYHPTYFQTQDISLQGSNAPPYMPCMWDQCEFRLETRGSPPVTTLTRSGNCPDSWEPPTPNSECCCT